MRIGIYEHKAKKGLIRATVKVYDDTIEVKITGDFMIFPEDMIFQLENNLKGLKVSDREAISRVVEDTLSKASLFGCEVGDFKTAIFKALDEVSR
ncbi:MAG: lipoate--protein ligase family protein [Sulfolobaceae archaeon]|nr:lipoate--protein ligase family protein [Sulfolobaceae archaeon]